MKAQRGFIALLMMVLVAVGVFGAMAAWVASEPPPSKQSINQQVLMQAREALLAYVAVGGTAALTQRTRLPCPDQDGNGVANTAANTNNCGVTQQTSLGLLPWSTLGLPPLRDADGECLWYAVSGDFKDAEVDPSAVPPPVAVNADTDGVITVADEARHNLATQVVAVVFAPGNRLGSQMRKIGTGGPCATPNSVAATDAADYLDFGNEQPPTAAGAPVTFTQMTGTIEKQMVLNDQLIWITTDDYAATATQRNAGVLLQALNQASTPGPASDGRLPFAAATPGGQCLQGLYSGFFPGSCPFADGNFEFNLGVLDAINDEWLLQAFYAVSPGCEASVCTGALSVPVNTRARAVVLMRGRRQLDPNCLTTTASTLNQWRPCIESQMNANALFTNPNSRAEPRAFVTPGSRPTSNDVLRELP